MHGERPRSRLRLVLGIGVVALAAAALSPTASAAPHRLLREFVPDGQYLMFFNGAVSDSARFFHSRRAGAYLVLDSGHPKPLVLLTRERRIVDVEPADVLVYEDGSHALQETTSPRMLCALRVDGADFVVDCTEFKARFRVKGPLRGDHDLAGLLKHSPQYGYQGALYRPRADVIQGLRAQGRPITVRVFFGSWCPMCQQYMPRAASLGRMLEGSRIRFRYFGLDSPPTGWQDPYVVGSNVRLLPTAVVYENDREIGRIAPQEWGSAETVLARVVGI